MVIDLIHAATASEYILQTLRSDISVTKDR